MIRTAECITPKHPDKICDRISDAILDKCLSQDPNSRVAVETCGGHGKVFVTGEITTNAHIGDIENIVNRICEQKMEVTTNIVKQSNFISQGVDTGGAGDQGIMVGYACNENQEYIPHELYLARDLCKSIYEYFPYDGKTQVTTDDGKIKTIVASFQNASKEELEQVVVEWLNHEPDGIEIHLNPAGDWSQGGFDADAGVTGRKLVVDNYGPRVPIGGGAFSGKDSSKVDRSAAYMARRIAVDLLEANEGAEEVYVYLAYAIGYDKPVQATAIIDGYEVGVEPRYDLSPNGIVKTLGLQEPKFEKTAEWGHMGTGQLWG
jgi:S-adenosylmethionine synthetase